MKRTLFFLFAILGLFSSCRFFDNMNGIEGNGKMKTENRHVDSFNSIEAGGNFEVHITQGPFTDIRIETDENLMEYIEIETAGDVLRIKTRQNHNIDPTGKAKVFVSAPVYKRLEASGASNLISETTLSSPDGLDLDLSGASNVKLDLKTPQIQADLSGASTANLKGEAKRVNVIASGASNFNCYDLLTESTDLNLSGASNAEVFASVELKAEASGASDAKYKGNPTVNQNVSGAGSVRKAD